MTSKKINLHPDLDQPWCRTILSNPAIQWAMNNEDDRPDEARSNRMFAYTLYTERGIRAHLSFGRPSAESEALDGREWCFLISIGDGVDGKAGRAHGGFSGVVLDHICGHVAYDTAPDPKNPPATATMTVDYKAPISTPCVILARAWLVEVSGRKVWVKAVLEDQDGNALARAKCLYVHVRQLKM